MGIACSDYALFATSEVQRLCWIVRCGVCSIRVGADRICFDLVHGRFIMAIVK